MRYRDARATALAAGAPITDVALSRAIGSRNATISEWRRRDDGFLAWLDEDARSFVRGVWPSVLLRAAQLAVQGSIEHMRFLARFVEQPESNSRATFQVLVGVPRPDGTPTGF